MVTVLNVSANAVAGAGASIWVLRSILGGRHIDVLRTQFVWTLTNAGLAGAALWLFYPVSVFTRTEHVELALQLLGHFLAFSLLYLLVYVVLDGLRMRLVKPQS
jgi:hypothetical protein